MEETVVFFTMKVFAQDEFDYTLPWFVWLENPSLSVKKNNDIYITILYERLG